MQAGTRLGHFEILEPLGRGGMGEVYRARDTHLERDVAIKVLPEDFAADPERLARFGREAKLLASLNHPNIAAIYGFEDAGGVRFIAMELVAGETIADRLASSGRIEVQEALEIARQIAEALEAAHENGVIHRDLKPANVIVTAAGKAKVLDFGLAKAYEADGSASDVSPDLSHSPTMMAATRMGVIMGTAAYMSPEQARGRRVDKRADIWAFGCLLLEMLTGEQAFSGRDAAETLAAVIQGEAKFDSLPPTLPAAIRRLIARCLKKDPRQRLRDIGDAQNELEDIRERPLEEPISHPGTVGRQVRTALPWALAILLATATLVLFLRQQSAAESNAPVRRFAIELPWQAVPSWSDFTAALSPQGTHIAYNGRVDNRVDVYVRALDSLEAEPLADARESDELLFSADGEWVGLFSYGGKLRKVSIHGGRAQDLASLGDFRVDGLSWGADGNILIGTFSGLYRVSESGGTPQPVTRLDAEAGEQGHLTPSHLPNRNKALISILHAQSDAQLAVVDLATGAVDPLPLHGTHPTYSATGHILYRQGSTVLAARFDLDDLTTSGDPVLLLQGVRYGPYLSSDGTLLYVPERGESNARLVWVDRNGHPTPIPGERLDYSHLDLSSSGGRTALLNIGSDVYVLDLERGTRRLLNDGVVAFPIWSADESRATFATFGSGGRGELGGAPALSWQLADSSSEAENLLEIESGDPASGDKMRPRGLMVPTSWNPDTGDLAFFDAASDVWILPPGGEAEAFLESRFNERSGRFSPDGQWMAYVSDETGEYQVYVVPFPGPGPKIAVSIGGGLSPIWSSDGQELFFRKGGKVLSAPVTYEPSLRTGQPVELFDGPYTLDLLGHQRYDVSADGQRFLMVENSDDFRVVIVLNWLQELKRLVPTGR